MRFLVDANLPPRLARWLAAMGHETEHVRDIGMQSATDAEKWTYARVHLAVIVTKDYDFVLRRRMARLGPRIVWIKGQDVRPRVLLAWFEPLLPQVLSVLDDGELLVMAL